MDKFVVDRISTLWAFRKRFCPSIGASGIARSDIKKGTPAEARLLRKKLNIANIYKGRFPRGNQP